MVALVEDALTLVDVDAVTIVAVLVNARPDSFDEHGDADLLQALITLCKGAMGEGASSPRAPSVAVAQPKQAAPPALPTPMIPVVHAQHAVLASPRAAPAALMPPAAPARPLVVVMATPSAVQFDVNNETPKSPAVAVPEPEKWPALGSCSWTGWTDVDEVDFENSLLADSPQP